MIPLKKTKSRSINGYNSVCTSEQIGKSWRWRRMGMSPISILFLITLAGAGDGFLRAVSSPFRFLTSSSELTTSMCAVPQSFNNDIGAKGSYKEHAIFPHLKVEAFGKLELFFIVICIYEIQLSSPPRSTGIHPTRNIIRSGQWRWCPYYHAVAHPPRPSVQRVLELRARPGKRRSPAPASEPSALTRRSLPTLP